MTSMARVPRCAGWVSAAIAALVPALAAAQPSQSDAAPGAWRCDVSLYGYLPSLSSTSSAPADANGTPIDINAKKIVDNLKLTAMAAFEAHNGSRGGSTDLIYLDLGGSKQQSREFTIGGAIAPVGATADLDWDFNGTIWTLAGECTARSRFRADPGRAHQAFAARVRLAAVAQRSSTRSTRLQAIHGTFRDVLESPDGLPGGTRTPGLLLRRQLLYPAELRAVRTNDSMQRALPP